MKEIEITVEVFQNIEEIDSQLKGQGFKILEKYDLIDYYYSKHSIEDLKRFEYKDLIANSFLIRKVVDDDPVDFLVYKNKTIDEDGKVISEEKIKCKLSNSESASKIFETIGLNCWCKLNQHIFVYEKEDVQFLVQAVDDLGIFIEYEATNNQGLSEYEILKQLGEKIQGLGLKIGKDFSCKKVYMKFKKDF